MKPWLFFGVIFIPGSCFCDSGFLGNDCSVREGQIPDQVHVADGGFCNPRQSDCGDIIVYGEPFANTGRLTCHLQEIEVCNLRLR